MLLFKRELYAHVKFVGWEKDLNSSVKILGQQQKNLQLVNWTTDLKISYEFNQSGKGNQILVQPAMNFSTLCNLSLPMYLLSARKIEKQVQNERN